MDLCGVMWCVVCGGRGVVWVWVEGWMVRGGVDGRRVDGLDRMGSMLPVDKVTVH